MLPLIAQAGEAAKVATEGASTLMAQWGVAGVLVIVWIVSAAVMIRWFMTALKEQRGEFMSSQKDMKDSFIAALKDEREACAKTALAQLAAYEKWMEAHHEVVKEWRKESLEESRATRDMIQLWVSRMALARATAESDDPAASGAKRKTGGGS